MLPEYLPTSRSTFAIEAPMILLGTDYDKEAFEPVQNHFIFFHEYLHYEQTTSWPILLVLHLARIIATHQQATGRQPSSNFHRIISRIRNLFPPTAWDDQKVAAAQGSTARPGVLALMEGNALLDAYRKPERYFAKSYAIQRITQAFGSRDFSRNRLHLIGMESCLACVGLGNHKFSGFNDAEESRAQLAAAIPELVAMVALQNTFLATGIVPGRFTTTMLFASIESHGAIAFVNAYLDEYEALCQISFGEHRFDTIMESLLVQERRTLGIVGAYTLLRYFHSLLFRLMGQEPRTYVDMIALGACLNLLRINEAYNYPTLSKFYERGLDPLWVPVPTLILTSGSLAASSKM